MMLRILNYLYWIVTFITITIVGGEVIGRVFDYRYDNNLAEPFGVGLGYGFLAMGIMLIVALVIHLIIFPEMD